MRNARLSGEASFDQGGEWWVNYRSRGRGLLAGIEFVEDVETHEGGTADPIQPNGVAGDGGIDHRPGIEAEDEKISLGWDVVIDQA